MYLMVFYWSLILKYATTSSLIISTYNWESALHLCLSSVLYQKYTPNEVIIADDGSCERTREVVTFFKKKISCAITSRLAGGQWFSIKIKTINKAKFEYVDSS
jgi:glycosyltransferase involved in cell wall biosynthesis